MLHLVRHARPRMVPGTPADQWRLVDDLDITSLASSGRLPDEASWWSSSEPKAVATAHALTDTPVTSEPDLAEQRRDGTWFERQGEFQAVVRRAFERPADRTMPGWEPLDATRARVSAAVRRIVETTDGDVVLVGHGTAWTLVVAELTARPPDLTSWQTMAMPDHCALERAPASSPAGTWRVAVPWSLGTW